ncbi:MAG: ABC transporter permease [Campylobacteraceae bacterium]|jgi:ABC-2 type transport system permease protein|nr:ABC transporter permease [Campylobacteraceae bacterium]
MIRIFAALLKKEFLIIFRDLHALLALFLLPSIFILIMSYALKDANSGSNIKCAYYIDDDNPEELVKNFEKAMSELENFSCQREINESFKSDITLSIPDGFFESFQNNADNDLQVRINYIPTLNNSAVLLFEALLKERIIMLFTDQSRYMPTFVANLQKPFIESRATSQKIPNSVEQSVPSWIVFAMFFVLIPFSTVFIIERRQGTYKRLMSMRLDIFLFFAAKTFTYNIINLFQGALLLSIGVYVVPLLGLNGLSIGDIPSVLALLYALSFAAVGFALFIAVVCKSTAQAVTVGGISNILLGAIGGIMVPKYIMPPLMQQISNISPMSWGFDAFIDLFLYEAKIGEIAQNLLFLLLFGVIMFIISLLIFTRNSDE